MVIACTQEDKYLGKDMLKHTYFDGNTENPNCLRGSHTLATCEKSIPCCQMLSMPRTYLPGIVSMCQTKVSPNTQSQGNTASFSLKAQRVASSEWTWHAHTHTCSETSYRITDVECISRAKNNPVKLTGIFGRFEVRNLSEVFLRLSSDAAQTSDCENRTVSWI